MQLSPINSILELVTKGIYLEFKANSFQICRHFGRFPTFDIKIFFHKQGRKFVLELTSLSTKKISLIRSRFRFSRSGAWSTLKEPDFGFATLGGGQCCGAGAGLFLLEPEPVKKLRLRAIAVWLRGTLVAK